MMMMMIVMMMMMMMMMTTTMMMMMMMIIIIETFFGAIWSSLKACAEQNPKMKQTPNMTLSYLYAESYAPVKLLRI